MKLITNKGLILIHAFNIFMILVIVLMYIIIYMLYIDINQENIVYEMRTLSYENHSR